MSGNDVKKIHILYMSGRCPHSRRLSSKISEDHVLSQLTEIYDIDDQRVRIPQGIASVPTLVIDDNGRRGIVSGSDAFGWVEKNSLSTIDGGVGGISFTSLDGDGGIGSENYSSIGNTSQQQNHGGGNVSIKSQDMTRQPKMNIDMDQLNARRNAEIPVGAGRR